VDAAEFPEREGRDARHERRVFLRSNAIIEPLVDRFYAWLHIVSPVRAAMNPAKVQVPLLESYLHSPQVHIAASNNPALRGGYFANIEEARAAEVDELLDTIKRGRAFLGMECDGAPLTRLYQALLTRPVTKKMSDSRELSGSNARQAAAIMTELGTKGAYVYAMGEESWQGHVMATTYTPDTYQIKQIEEFLTWCKEHDVVAEHLLNIREWRW
jgi:Diiron non-heme beta-hydroxylase N-terminal domain